MFKFNLMVLICIAAAVFSTEAYCQKANPNFQVTSVSGKVVRVDVESGIITLNIDDREVVFYLMDQSKMYKTTQHMATIEIQKGDPVIIQYFTALGKNDIISLVDKKDET
jgi:hypothetical protein